MYRNKIERQEEVKKIIESLTKLNLTLIYEPIKELFAAMRKYIDNEINIKINIPFYEINKTIIGQLYIEKKKECWIKLTND